MTEVLGIALALLVGIIMGLTGAGGSILTIPILVYVLGIDPVIATAYSLVIVGVTSLFGSINFLRKGLVHLRVAIIFAIPSLITVFITRKYVLPNLPEQMLEIGGLYITKGVFIMLLFASLMLLSALSMIRNRTDFNENEIEGELNLNFGLIILEGLVIGLLTGLVGAGGGFLIVPVLAIFVKLPMRMAIATSLLIIALKSLLGFLGDIEHAASFDWQLIIEFNVLAVLGIFVGSYLSKFIDGKKLKPIFGYFVLLVSIYIIFQEIIIATY